MMSFQKETIATSAAEFVLVGPDHVVTKAPVGEDRLRPGLGRVRAGGLLRNVQGFPPSSLSHGFDGRTWTNSSWAEGRSSRILTQPIRTSAWLEVHDHANSNVEVDATSDVASLAHILSPRYRQFEAPSFYKLGLCCHLRD